MPSNNLYGSLPTQLGRLTLLGTPTTSILLDFVAVIRLSTRLTFYLLVFLSIERLQFRGNMLDGAVPTELGRLMNLFVLGLGRNELHGTIPSELANMQSLGKTLQT